MGGAISGIHWGVAAAFVMLWTVALLDDLVGLPPTVRLFAQTGSAVLLWHAGLRISVIGGAVSSIFATCVFVVAFVNAFNFLDGADGLAAGVSCIIAVAFILSPRDLRTASSYPVACSIAGACAAFLVFNSTPATIFMGDSGSTVLGLGLAVLGLSSSAPHISALRTAMFLLLAR